MDSLGLLRIRVRRGINLVVRDSRSSDPYVIIECGLQKVKTRVVKNSCNPVWDDELTIYVKDLDVPVILSVHDKDTFTVDDPMGDAQIDIWPYVECLKMGLKDIPDGTIVNTVEPNSVNLFGEKSSIVWSKGKLKQDMILKLRNVEHGEVDVQVEWIDLPGSRGLHSSG